MDTIANNSDTSKDMMQAMMNSSKGKMMMTNHENMMNDNPDMMKGMMEASKTDTMMMSEMCKSMMDNPKMIDIIKDK